MSGLRKQLKKLNKTIKQYVKRNENLSKIKIKQRIPDSSLISRVDPLPSRCLPRSASLRVAPRRSVSSVAVSKARTGEMKPEVFTERKSPTSSSVERSPFRSICLEAFLGSKAYFSSFTHVKKKTLTLRFRSHSYLFLFPWLSLSSKYNNSFVPQVPTSGASGHSEDPGHGMSRFKVVHSPSDVKKWWAFL